MTKNTRFSPEVRQRAVRMVLESQGEYDSQWAAICSIAPKIGCTPETLRVWVRQHERDTGSGDGGLTTAERQRLKELERENRELRRSNDIHRKLPEKEVNRMTKNTRFSPEVRQRAVRMVLESQGEYDSQWAAICSIAPKIGCTPETLRVWVRQHERDTGSGDGGLTTAERQRLKELERENRELRRSNDILRQASAYFAKAEFDRLWKK